MKLRSLLFFLFLFLVLESKGQASHALYFMNEWSQRHLMNPSFAPQYGYVSVPMAGNISFGVSSNIGVSTVIFPYNDQYVTFMHPSVSPSDILSQIHDNNYVFENATVSLLSAGFYSSLNSFWSFDVSLTEQSSLNLPRDFFRLAKLGMATSNNSYNLGQTSTNSNYIGALSIGHSISLNDHFRIGWKVKLLAGMSSVEIKYKQFNVNLAQNSWNVTADGEASIHSHMASIGTDTAGMIDIGSIKSDYRNLRPSGYGAALDFGFTYEFIRGLTVAASFSNLGFMTWMRNATTKGVAQNSTTFNGFTNVDLGNVQVQDQLDQLQKDAEALIQFKESNDPNEYTSERLDPSWNMSAEYSIFKNDDHDIQVGILYENYFDKLRSFDDLVGTVSFRPCSWLMASGSYTLAGDGVGGFGAALTFSPRWVNIVLASDCFNFKMNKQFLPIRPVHTTLQLGVSIPLYTNIDKRKMKKKKLYHNFKEIE